MKTQITYLINGKKNVIRDKENVKYATARIATSHIGYAGTSNKQRQEIATQVYAENGDTLHITIRGIELTMPIHKSMSGKSWLWSTELTEEQYHTICGSSLGVGKNLNSYTLTFYDDCTVEISVYHRENERQAWRCGYTQYIDEAFVTIL